MRRLISLAAILFLGLSSTGFGPPGLIESSDAQTPLFSYQLGLIGKLLELPSILAPSAAIIDGDTGQVLYAKNAHARMAPASVTKIMTAIVALENGRLGDYAQIKVNAWAMPGSSVMGLEPGEVLSLEELLYGMLLPSGNDAALAIAEHVGGSVEHFVQMMNDKARELDLKDTHFVNPHGLDDPDHYSSSYDLAMLGRYAMRNPTFAKIVNTPSYIAKGKKTYVLLNGNHLLGQYEGLDGVKTGFTDNAGQSYVASVTRDGHRVFVGLIKSDDRYRDASRLFDYFFREFGWTKLNLPASPFYSTVRSDGASTPLVITTPKVEPLPSWEKPYLRSFVRLDDSPAPTTSGAEQPSISKSASGSALFYLGSDSLGELPVGQQ